MKKLILQTAAFICVMTIQSCNNNQKNEVKSPEQPVKPAHTSFILKSSVHVPLAVAQNNIQRYNEMCMKTLKNVPVRAYTIHSEDLLEVLGVSAADSTLCTYKHARAYLGLDSLGSFKLYFTPVEGADLGTEPKKPGKDVILQDAEGNPYVLDLNAPCPMTCDLTSPLYFTTMHE